jgi:hypothetical protein
MDKITGDEPAGVYIDTGAISQPSGGLTIRQKFAESAMQGLLSTLSAEVDWCPNLEGVKYAAQLAVKAADFLIEELNKPTDK